MSEKKIKKECCSELVCKSTAKLKEQVKKDLEKTDGSLKELLENDTKRKETESS